MPTRADERADSRGRTCRLAGQGRAAAGQRTSSRAPPPGASPAATGAAPARHQRRDQGQAQPGAAARPALDVRVQPREPVEHAVAGPPPGSRGRRPPPRAAPCAPPAAPRPAPGSGRAATRSRAGCPAPAPPRRGWPPPRPERARRASPPPRAGSAADRRAAAATTSTGRGDGRCPASARASAIRSASMSVSRSASTATARSVSSASAGSGCATATSACARMAATGERSSCAASPVNRSNRATASSRRASNALISSASARTSSVAAGIGSRSPGGNAGRRRPHPVDRTQRRPGATHAAPATTSAASTAPITGTRRPARQWRPAHEVRRRHHQPRSCRRGDRALRDPAPQLGEPPAVTASPAASCRHLPTAERQRRALVDGLPGAVDHPDLRRRALAPALQPATARHRGCVPAARRPPRPPAHRTRARPEPAQREQRDERHHPDRERDPDPQRAAGPPLAAAGPPAAHRPRRCRQVAVPAHGPQHVPAADRVQLAPHVPDVDLHDVAARRLLVAPDQPQQLVLGHRRVRAG